MDLISRFFGVRVQVPKRAKVKKVYPSNVSHCIFALVSFCVFLHVTTWFLRFLVVIICDFISTIEILRFIWTIVCCPIEAWASRLGLDESVVRCALPWQQQFPATSDGRCCLFNSVATPMLIAILAKGSYGAGKSQGGCADEADREKMHALLAGLLMLLPKTCS